MAFVTQYKHDLFISYAHVDDQPLPGADNGWVTSLIHGLSTKLGQKLGRSDAFDLWMDYKLAGNVQLTPQILQALNETAVIVIILSPGYIASDWCNREKSTFLRLIADKQRAGSRVFVVERDRIDDTRRPTEFRELLGYRFWIIDREGKSPRILGEPKPDPSDPRYYDRLTDLCVEIADELHRLKYAETSTTFLPAAGQTQSGPTVFLAEATDDLEEKRDEVKRYLLQHDIRVLPECLFSRDPAQFSAAIENDLNDCTLFIQLLSGLRGKAAFPDTRTFTRIQYDCARKTGKSILQWRSRDTQVSNVTDEAYRSLLCSESVMAVGLEEFKKTAVDRARYKPPAATENHDRTFVFVNRDSSDSAIAEKVCTSLDRLGAEYALPLDEGKPSEIRQDLEENLLDCDRVIIVYGVITVAWVREQLRQCRKILSRRTRPIKAFAVFEGPPESKIPLGLKLSNMQVINCRKGLQENELMEFVND